MATGACRGSITEEERKQLWVYFDEKYGQYNPCTGTVTAVCRGSRAWTPLRCRMSSRVRRSIVSGIAGASRDVRETLVCIRKTATRHKRGERNHHLVRTSERDVSLYLSLSVPVLGRETLVETDLFERRWFERSEGLMMGLGTRDRERRVGFIENTAMRYRRGG